MLKRMRKHYMPILATMIFVSIFLYQFFILIQIPYIQQYSLQTINYFNLIIYLLLVLFIVTNIYNLPLLLVIEISQSFKLPNLHISFNYQKYSVIYQSITLIKNRYKSYSVFRCWFIVFSIHKNKNYERIMKWNIWKKQQKSYFCVL